MKPVSIASLSRIAESRDTRSTARACINAAAELRFPSMTLFSASLRGFLTPVLPYLDDPAITEIMINGPLEIWVEQGGLLHKTAARFTEDGLLAAARNMAQFVGRPLSEENPRLDARLPDGSRIHVILPPLARCGTVIAIRKFHPGGLTMDDLIRFGSITPEAARFLQVVVLHKQNLMVAGGTGSGKTTLLNVLSQFIPNDERILTIEDSAELQLNQEHLVPLESRPADRHGRHAVSIRDLLHSALRLRPDRIVIGEVRGGECFDLLQAMNTGHGGTLCTVHANSSLETLSRLESLALLADVGLPLRAIRSQVASAIGFVVCAARLRDGSRKLTAISEVLPLDQKGDYRAQDIFVFTQTRSAREEQVEGYLAPTGVSPSFREKLVADGFDDMAPSFFDPASYGLPAPRYFLGSADLASTPSRPAIEGQDPDRTWPNASPRSEDYASPDQARTATAEGETRAPRRSSGASDPRRRASRFDPRQAHYREPVVAQDTSPNMALELDDEGK
jgi:pilus assembly protein CpaF